jgi:hypothetical protein
VRKAMFGLGCFLLLACGAETKGSSSESGSAAASGEEATGGSPETGGDSSTGGTTDAGGSSSGGSPRGGRSSGGGGAAGTTGGSKSSGNGGETEGGEAGAAGSSDVAGNGGYGASGGQSPTRAVCDPALGELDATPYPDCRPRVAGDACEQCIEAECCPESKVCYGYEPGNVCGWGGPTTGSYTGLNEIDCYVACARDYVTRGGAYDDATDSVCVPTCTTPTCGLIGSATQALVLCLREHCDEPCFSP